jgi:hypothetical protein
MLNQRKYACVILTHFARLFSKKAAMTISSVLLESTLIPALPKIVVFSFFVTFHTLITILHHFTI